jgi:CheY-like chemotaxis protein/MinD-like ATPase involved in chromosome partitioning or flagellar assembly
MSKKVLVVDDNLDVIKMIGLMLQHQGYEIIAAQSGSQALTKAQAENPDVIILDIMMPGVDGYEVCRRLRADPITANTPILMFTAKTSVSDKVAGFEAGADDYLTKPIRPSDLVSRLEAVLLRSGRRTGKEQLPLRARIIGFIGAKGGVGTTTLAVNVAVAMAVEIVRGKQVVLADLRSGSAGVALQLGLNHGGIVRLLGQPLANIDMGTVGQQLQDHKSGVKVLSGQIEPPGAAMLIPHGHAEAIVQYLGSAADYLLLDLGTGVAEPSRHILPMCHQIVVVIEPHRMALSLAQALLVEMTQSLQVPSHKIGLVMVNKAPSGATFTKDAIAGLLLREIIGIVTPAPDLAFQSGERGIPIVMIDPASLVARQFRNVAEYLAAAIV